MTKSSGERVHKCTSAQVHGCTSSIRTLPSGARCCSHTVGGALGCWVSKSDGLVQEDFLSIAL